MSGFVARVSLDGASVSEHDLTPMMTPMAHRARDGSALLARGAVGLGYLETTVAPETQRDVLPLWDDVSRRAITGDIRLDNRDDLTHQLRSAPNISDSELVLLAYEKWGTDCPAHLVGAFAFVVWDERNGHLFGARDHLGQKPFNYLYNPGRLFAAASEAKGLWSSLASGREIDETRIADFLLGVFVETEGTLYKNIYRLPPAHTVVVDARGLRLSRYWQLEQQYLEEQSDEEYAQRFRELFSTAVEASMRSRDPVAVQLSGGLDSSAVACVAHEISVRQGRGAVRSYSAIFDEVEEADERRYIDVMARAGIIEPRWFKVEEVDPLNSLDETYRYIDTGPAGSAHFLVWTAYRNMATDGQRVVLDGIDGDTTVDHGYGRFEMLASAGEWPTFIEEARRSATNWANFADRMAVPHHTSSLDLILRAYALPVFRAHAEQRMIWTTSRLLWGLSNSLPEFPLRAMAWRYARTAVLGRRVVRRRHASDWQRRIGTLNPEFARRVDAESRLALQEEKLGSQPDVRRSQIRMFMSGAIAHVLEPTELAASVFGLDVRHPFFDRRLVEFCVSLPVSQSWKNGWPRYVLRESLRGILPDEIRRRVDKTNFTNVHRRALLDRKRQDVHSILVRSPYLHKFVAKSELSRIRAQLSSPQKDDFTRVESMLSVHKLLDNIDGV